jgi:hypothetical protein
MVTPTEIANLIAQAWELDPEENFFEFLYDVFQTNGTLFSLGELSHDQVQLALNTYIESGGNTDEGDTSSDSTGDTGNPEGDSAGTA